MRIDKLQEYTFPLYPEPHRHIWYLLLTLLLLIALKVLKISSKHRCFLLLSRIFTIHVCYHKMKSMEKKQWSRHRSYLDHWFVLKWSRQNTKNLSIIKMKLVQLNLEKLHKLKKTFQFNMKAGALNIFRARNILVTVSSVILNFCWEIKFILALQNHPSWNIS